MRRFSCNAHKFVAQGVETATKTRFAPSASRAGLTWRTKPQLARLPYNGIYPSSVIQVPTLLGSTKTRRFSCNAHKFVAPGVKAASKTRSAPCCHQGHGYMAYKAPASGAAI